MIDPKYILLKILELVQSKGWVVGKAQLIKLLYLIEVEYFRETRYRLTNLDWLFYYYGPYAFETERILEELEFQQEIFKTKEHKDFIKYQVAEGKHKYDFNIDPKVSQITKLIVTKWGRKNLSELLDYVYFETEPMQNVKTRGEKLDFSSIGEGKREAVYDIIASKESRARIEKLRSTLQLLFASSVISGSIIQKTDDDERDAIIAWDDDREPDLSGIQVQFIPTESSSFTSTA